MAKHGTLLTVKMPPEPLIQMIKQKLKEKLERYAEEMKSNVSQGTSPASPSWWVGNIQSYIDVEDLGSGALIVFGVGLENGTPEQALWQAYIFNFGSGHLGKNGMIYSHEVTNLFYNVNLDSWWPGGERRYSSGNLVAYPQFAKGKNRWFDSVSDKIAANFSSIMNEVVRESVAALFASGAWTLKGHRVTVKL